MRKRRRFAVCRPAAAASAKAISEDYQQPVSPLSDVTTANDNDDNNKQHTARGKLTKVSTRTIDLWGTCDITSEAIVICKCPACSIVRMARVEAIEGHRKDEEY